MGKKRVADLHAALTANTTPYETSMRRAANATRNTEMSITRSLSGLAQKGAKFGLGFFGVESALKGVQKEFREVLADIEHIQGVDPATVESVKKFEGNIAQAKHTLDQFVAGGISGAVSALEALRFQMDAVRFGDDKARQLQGERRAEAQQAVLDSPDEIKRRAEATKELAAARAELAQVGEADSTRVARLRAEADALEKSVAELPQNDVAKISALTSATKMRTDAQEAYVRLVEREKAAQSEAGSALQFYSGTALKGRESVRALEAAVQRLSYELAQLGGDGPEALEARIKKYEELRRAGESLEKAQERVNQTAEELGLTFSSAFEDAIVGGEKLSDVLNGLAQDVIRLFVRQSITAPMASALSGFFKGVPGMLGFADGGSPPVGVPSIVGERGPELFVPKTAGTIVPNHALGGESVVVNQSYNIGAGVTAQQLMPILAMQKREIIATIADARRRRTSLGAALG